MSVSAASVSGANRAAFGEAGHRSGAAGSDGAADPQHDAAAAVVGGGRAGRAGEAASAGRVRGGRAGRVDRADRVSAGNAGRAGRCAAPAAGSLEPVVWWWWPSAPTLLELLPVAAPAAFNFCCLGGRPEGRWTRSTHSLTVGWREQRD